MEVNNAQKIMENQLMIKMFKSILGDSVGFQAVLESLTNATDKGGSFDFANQLLGESDLSKLGYGEGKLLTSVTNKIDNEIKSDVKSGSSSIDEAIMKASKKYGIDEALIKAVIKQESSFNPNAVSKSGAEGLMQLMPSTARGLGVTNSFDIDQNVDGGTKYLKGLLDVYGNSKLALAAYNAGPNALKNKGIDTEGEINKLSFETRNYVSKIMNYYGK